MNDISDLSGAIVIKTDQLNAEDFIGDITMDIVITRVDYKKGASQQSLSLHSEGLQPFKPCLTMIKALIEIWGKDGRQWVGRTLTLYRRIDVDFGKQKNIGGVRISHFSDMPSPVHKMMLTVRRGLKEEHTFYRWEPTDYTAIIKRFMAIGSQEEKDAVWVNFNEAQRTAINNSITGVK